MRKLLLIFLLLALAGTAQATTIARVKTWAAREILTTADLNAEFDNLINFLNGSISLVNIDSTTRYRVDTLDFTYGLRYGAAPSTASAGRVLWDNGGLFIGVTKDSAGIVDKTGTQTITGKKTFSDTTTFSGPLIASGEGTYTNHVWFAVKRPRMADSLLIPTDNHDLVTKFYIDSTDNLVRAAAYDSAVVVVTANNVVERPAYADSAARVVTDSLQQATLTIGGILQVDTINAPGTRLYLVTTANDSLVVTGLGRFINNLEVVDTLLTNEAALDTIWSPNGRVYVKDSLWVQENLTVRDTIKVNGDTLLVFHRPGYGVFSNDRSIILVVDANNNETNQSFQINTNGVTGTTIFTVSEVNSGNTTVGGNLTVTDTTNTTVLNINSVGIYALLADSLVEVRAEAKSGLDSLNVNLYIPTPGAMADSTCRGSFVFDTVGETVTFGQVLYRKGGGWYKADADTNTTLPALMMATRSISAGAVGKLMREGYAKAAGWNWSMADGSRYLRADNTTAGAMVATAVASGVWQQYVAVPVAPTVVYFKPDILPVLMK